MSNLEPGSEPIQRNLELAEEFLRAARALIDAQEWRSSVDRSYYAMFHAAQALLLLRGFKSRSHQAAIKLFSQHLVRTGTFDPTIAKELAGAFENRMQSTYSPIAEFAAQDAHDALQHAEKFVAETLSVLNR